MISYIICVYCRRCCYELYLCVTQKVVVSVFVIVQVTFISLTVCLSINVSQCVHIFISYINYYFKIYYRGVLIWCYYHHYYYYSYSRCDCYYYYYYFPKHILFCIFNTTLTSPHKPTQAVKIFSSGGRTALHYAASNGEFDTVKYLVEHGLDKNAKDFDG